MQRFPLDVVAAALALSTAMPDSQKEVLYALDFDAEDGKVARGAMREIVQASSPDVLAHAEFVMSNAAVVAVAINELSSRTGRYRMYEVGEQIVFAEEITTHDLLQAVGATPAQFGAADDSAIVAASAPHGIQFFDDTVGSLLRSIQQCCRRVQEGKRLHALRVLVYGPPGCGLSALAAAGMTSSAFHFQRYISSGGLKAMSDKEREVRIVQAFQDAAGTPCAAIVLDDLEALIGHVPLNNFFSVGVRTALMSVLQHSWTEEVCYVICIKYACNMHRSSSDVCVFFFAAQGRRHRHDAQPPPDAHVGVG